MFCGNKKAKNFNKITKIDYGHLSVRKIDLRLYYLALFRKSKLHVRLYPHLFVGERMSYLRF